MTNRSYVHPSFQLNFYWKLRMDCFATTFIFDEMRSFLPKEGMSWKKLIFLVIRTQNCLFGPQSCTSSFTMGPWTIPSSGHEGNEFLSTHPLLRWKASHFIKDERGGKAIHPKLPIEVHLIGRVNITSIGHQSKSRIKIWTLIHLIWLASIDNRGYECEFISLDSIGKAWGWIL